MFPQGDSGDQSAAELSGVPVIVLCGGRGSRMGPLTTDRPKPLLPIRGRPILQYVLSALQGRGVRRVILPVGYRGDEIARYVRSLGYGDDFDVQTVDTGEDARISERLRRIGEFLPDAGEIVLANGDTVFDFALDRAVRRHREGGHKVTLCTVSIRSQFGLVLSRGGQVVGFERNAPVASFALPGRPDTAGLINAGIAVIDAADLRAWLDGTVEDPSDGFEELYYGPRCAAGEAGVYEIEGFWKNFDTARDLDDANRPEFTAVLERLVAAVPRLPPGGEPVGDSSIAAMRSRARASSKALSWADAAAEWRRVVVACPGDRDALFGEAFAHHSLSDYRRAEALYRRARVTDPAAGGPPPAVIDRWFGKLLIKAGRPKEGLRVLRPIIGVSPAAARLYARASTAPVIPEFAGVLQQETLLDRLDESRQRIDEMPAADTAIRLLRASADSRASSPSFHIGFEDEADQVLRPAFQQPPLVLGVYRDAAVLPGGIVTTSRRTVLAETIYANSINPPVGRARILHRKSRLVADADGGMRYTGRCERLVHRPYPVLNLVSTRHSYGALLTTQLTRLIALDWIGLPDLRILVRPLDEFALGGLLEALKIPRDRVVEMMPDTAMSFEAVLVTNYPMYEYGWIVREAMRPLVQVRDFFLRGHPPKRRRLYVSRRDTRSRRLLNEAAVFSVLEPLGFEMIVPSELEWSDKVRAFADAEIVVGSNGSGLYNALFSRVPGMHLIVVFDGFDGPRTVFIAGELVGAKFSYIRAGGPWSAEALGGKRTHEFEIDPEIVAAAVRQAIADLPPAERNA